MPGDAGAVRANVRPNEYGTQHSGIRVLVYIYLSIYMYIYAYIYVYICICIYICTYMDMLTQHRQHDDPSFGSLALGGIPREQKMLKGYLPRVIYHPVH